MEEKVKTENFGVIHQIAHCQDCDWMNEDYHCANKEGRKHTRKTGHTVSIETGTHYRYYI